ncbi:phosphoglycerol transferase MdoB-like AlkP superfamily enzyme [Neorhizobium sp. R1-B]|nr:phosphoglycerol transferase MdoB-like AlkP superfamily enzyme [Neorhizobium sp. S3-V5DH]TDX81944.1 phosphoglycerol transferase MdoB-like AlkP superfamily enzyme [Neorhizobium sp. R1-B]
MNEYRPFRARGRNVLPQYHTRPAVNRFSTLRITISLLLVALILALPSNPQSLVDLSDVRFPLEVAGLAFLASTMSGRFLALLRWSATLLAGAMLLLKLADLGTGIAFQRPFNPYLDVKILTDGWNLLSGAVGAREAVGIICAGLLAWLLVVALLYWSLGGFRNLSSQTRRRLAIGSGVLLLVGLTLFAVQDDNRRNLGVDAPTFPYIVNRIDMIRESNADLDRFEAELGRDAVSSGPHFAALSGMDVVLVFIESYGRSVIEDPSYALRIHDRLAAVEHEVQASGLQARSGWLTSPTVGGLSWLAHGTLLSGLWVDNQSRYDRMITSERRSLNSLFRASGWRTAAVMPAITLDWPESAYFGYDRVHAAAGLGYKGKPFNWVTMPDQYTLAVFEKLERSPGHRPLMAEIALISSHAPWTPIPSLVDWDKVGDGTIFNDQAESGDPASVVWADPERVRSQYAASIDYALETLGSYMARYGENTLFILLGDHQPASIITGEGASRDVPVHLVTGNPEILKRIDPWKWQPGMLPTKDTPVYRMDEFRQKFVESFD